MNTVALLFSLLAAPAAGESGVVQEAAGAPRLVVLVSVDQMIPEQLDRLEPWLSGGLARFQREGRIFRAAELGYARTETGPGHATLATGTYPSTHGVVGNQFFDRETRKLVYCVGDESVARVTSRGVTQGTASVSPRSLRVPGLGEYLAASSGGCKVVSIAGKDRASVALGGMEPEVALWWDRRGGGFSSSTYYGEELPAWVLDWNGTWPERYADFADGGWKPLVTDLAGSGTVADDREGEMHYTFRRRAFPYELPALDSWSGGAALARAAATVYSTPLVDEFVLSLARDAVEQLELGADGDTDLLAIGLSACDITGHSFGPYSCEVTDVLLRVDVGLGELFDLLDERLGPEGWIACLSADHGVLDLPEGLVAHGVDAERLPNARIVGLREEIADRLEQAFESDLGLDYIGGMVFDQGQIEARELDPARVWDLAASVAREVDWLARAFTFAELRTPDAEDGDPLRLLMARSVAEGRGPDVSLALEPWTLLSIETGTSHGSPHPYDRRIPLVFLGPGFAPGTTFAPAGAVDVVPTLLDALGLEIPARVEGRALARE